MSHDTKTLKHANKIIELANRTTGAKDGDNTRIGKIIEQADKIVELHDTPAPPVRQPYYPHLSQWLYSLDDPQTRGWRVNNQTAHTTLHLGCFRPNVAKEMVRRCAELKHTHVVVCTRAGMDAQRSFGLSGTYDWLVDPDACEWLFDLCEQQKIGLYFFLLEDDDREFNANWNAVRDGWKRFLNRWGDHPYLSAVLTGIEVDETWGEGSTRPQSRKVRTIENTKQRIEWLRSNYPGLPIGEHYTPDTALWCGADFMYYQTSPRHHDDRGHSGDLRKKHAIADEFGPNRRGGEAIEANQLLMLGEVADPSINGHWLRQEVVPGARLGLRNSTLPDDASGMGDD